MFMYFFSQKEIKVFDENIPWIIIHIVYFNGLQTVEGQNYRFSAASKAYKWYQTMNKGLI